MRAFELGTTNEAEAFQSISNQHINHPHPNYQVYKSIREI